VACKGLGIVAVSDIEPGQLILSETPLILSKQEKTDSLTVNQARQIFRQVSRLNKIQKKQMMSLCCPGERKVLNIFKINCIQVDTAYIGLFLIISRINHSCCPNSIDCHGSIKEVRAMKHIKKGEEITLSYIINSYDSKAVREIELNYWHFKCSCNACKLTGERLLMNEQIREKIVENNMKISEFVGLIIALQENSEAIAEDARRLLHCDLYVNIRQMLSLCESNIDLMLSLKDQMLRQLFTAHLNALLLYYKAISLGVCGDDKTDRRVKHHAVKLEKMVEWCKDWRSQLAEAVGRGIMFSVCQGKGGGYHYS